MWNETKIQMETTSHHWIKFIMNVDSEEKYIREVFSSENKQTKQIFDYLKWSKYYNDSQIFKTS